MTGLPAVVTPAPVPVPAPAPVRAPAPARVPVPIPVPVASTAMVLSGQTLSGTSKDTRVSLLTNTREYLPIEYVSTLALLMITLGTVCHLLFWPAAVFIVCGYQERH